MSPGANAKGGHCPKTPSPEQPSISSIQEGHWQLQYDMQNCSSGRPLTQHGQKSHPNIQGPLCWCPQWLCPHFPYTPLVPTFPTGRTTTSSPPTITTPSQLICLCTHLWPPQLQHTSIRSNWDGGPCTGQTTQMSNLCRTLQKGVCPWHVHQTLSVLEILVKGNPSYANLGCHVFQAQIPD
jgi:hypothetical protein